MGATRSATSPSSAVAAARSSAPAPSTAAPSVRPRRTRPRSVLCAIASPWSFTATGKPTSAAAATASPAVATTRSGAKGTPNGARSTFDADSDRVRVSVAGDGSDPGLRIWEDIGGRAYGPRVAGRGTVPAMQIVAALFTDEINLRQVAGPSTRIDLTGIQFSAVAPTPLPLVWAPHLVVIIHCAVGEATSAALEVVYERDGEQIARNVQPVEIEQGKFGYRLVRAELEFEDYGTIHARCRIDLGPETVVPYTLLAPPEA